VDREVIGASAVFNVRNWRDEWADKYREDGIVAADQQENFHCNFCEADYRIGGMGEASITQHLRTQRHKKKKTAILPPTTMRTTNITTGDLRPSFVYLVKEKNMTREEVASLFGVNPHTVGARVTRFEETGGVKNRAGQGKNRSATDNENVEEVPARCQQPDDEKVWNNRQLSSQNFMEDGNLAQFCPSNLQNSSGSEGIQGCGEKGVDSRAED